MKELSCPMACQLSPPLSLPHVSEVSARYLLSLQNCHCLPTNAVKETIPKATSQNPGG